MKYVTCQCWNIEQIILYEIITQVLSFKFSCKHSCKKVTMPSWRVSISQIISWELLDIKKMLTSINWPISSIQHRDYIAFINPPHSSSSKHLQWIDHKPRTSQGWSKMTLNYQMIVEQHPNWTEWLEVRFLTVKWSLH